MLRSTSCLALLLLPLGAASAQTAPPPAHINAPPPAHITAPPPAHIHEVYDVMREGSKIGTSTTDIERQGDVVNVKMSADINVKIMYVSVYKFTSKSTESWHSGHFVAYESNVDDNGTKYAVTATGSADKVNLDVNGKREAASGGLVPASMWSRDFLKHAAVFDPDNGKRISLKVTDAGDEKIVVDGVTYQAHHYKIAGDFARELWFDGDRLIRMKLVGSDKSVIISDLRAQS